MCILRIRLLEIMFDSGYGVGANLLGALDTCWTMLF